MAKPTYYPEWATTDTTLPVAETSNKSRPKESLRTIGWDKSQIPAAEELNWQFDNVYDWVVYFDTLNSVSKTVTFIGDVSGSFSFSNDSSTIGDVTLQVADNSHNHLSSNITDATELATANKLAKRDANGSIAFKNILGDRVVTNSSGTSNDPTNPSIAFSETVNDTGLYPISDNVFGVTTGGVSRGYWDSNGWNGNVVGNASTVTSVAGNVTILTGTISNGGTIPLPAGYTEAQCKWLVSINDSNSDNMGWDISEASAYVHVKNNCSATGTRLVTATVTVNDNGTLKTYNASANYIIIGVK